jgi:phenylalanyl-tRNA synthetase alpha chain
MDGGLDELQQRFRDALTEGLRRIESAEDLTELEEARVRVLGRKAPLAQARSGLKDVPNDQKAAVGKVATDVHRQLERALSDKRAVFEAKELEGRWERERIDVTLPPPGPGTGGIHPLTRTLWEILDLFVGLGYRVVEGPEVELSVYNFDALNIPPQHPARAPQDTFYIEGTEERLALRPQTSPMQIRTMESQAPPVYVVVPGRVYRPDEVDPTHLNSFTQVEGLAVDEGITMGDLKGSLTHVMRQIFGATLDIRLRPHHFPFTEPSAELDVQCFKCMGKGCRLCKWTGWIEILGCGVVHPFLLEWVGYDAERYTGFAFGMGVERITALAHGVPDLRYFYENDLHFLSHFKGIA